MSGDGSPRGPKPPRQVGDYTSRGAEANFEGTKWSPFGALVRQRRLELNLTMKALATKAKLDHSYISRIERGERPPPAPWVIDQLCTALDFPPARAMRFYWAAGVIPPFFRDPDVEEPIFEALRAIAESDNPARAIALLRLGAAASSLLETMESRQVKLDPDLLLRALANGR